MKKIQLRMLALVAACALSLASMGAGAVVCKSGQKPAATGSQACTAAPAKSTAKSSASGSAKSKAAPKAAAKSKAPSRSKAAAKGKGKSKARITRSQPDAASALEPPPPNNAVPDCDSAQTLLQGGAAQCPLALAANGANAPAGLPANPGSACFASLAASNATRQLASRVPFLTDSAPGPEVLANKSLPSARDREQLHSVVAGYGMCLDIASAWRQQAYAPARVQALDAFWLEARSILGELAAGKRNFGDAARALADSDRSFKSQLGSR